MSLEEPEQYQYRGGGGGGGGDHHPDALLAATSSIYSQVNKSFWTWSVGWRDGFLRIFTLATAGGSIPEGPIF